jgi:hypothetical protein
MLDTGLADVAAAALKKAHSYIEQSQVRCCFSVLCMLVALQGANTTT